VNRQVLAIVCIGLVLLTGAVVFISLSRQPSEPQKTVTTAKPAAPPPVVRKAPKVDVPAPPPESARSSARRVAPPTVEPPAPAPAPAEPSPEAAILHIETDVPGARVFIDREYVGVAPLTAPDLAPGTHRLNLSAEGYEGIADDINVSAGPREVMVRFKEVRLDAKIDVIHKHRAGSCKGRLTATPQGLRYETTNKDDAFSVSLLDLDVFEVNYLEKNLRVQPRKSKRYDFTDPQGNADRLFVFQRDVEKARERLQKGDPPAKP
jgi:hypothetical protein